MRMLWGFCVLSTLLACTHEDEKKGRPVLAMVTGTPIFLDEFKQRYERSRVVDADGMPNAASDDMVKKVLLDDWIDRILLLREAEKKNIVVGIYEVDAVFQRLKNGWDETEYAELLRSTDLTVSDIKRDLREELVLKKFLGQHVFARVAVTDEEIGEYMRTHPELQLVPERLRARHIVVRTREAAEEALRRLRDKSFEDLAMEISVAPEGKNGGDLGEFSRGEMPKLVEEACFALKVGDVSAIIEGSDGFHLFKITERLPETLKPLAEVHEKVEGMLRRDKEVEAQQKLILRLKGDSKIEVKQDVLAALQ